MTMTGTVVGRFSSSCHVRETSGALPLSVVAMSEMAPGLLTS